MKYLQQLMQNLEKEAGSHTHDIFNYALPQSWNLFGFSKTRTLRNKEILVNPYDFYLYSFQHLFYDAKGKMKKAVPLATTGWLKKACIYSVHIRSLAAWDHDRDDSLKENLYGLKDNGTFLKAILLLPFYQRMGINTILLHQPFALGKTEKAHDYAQKECVVDFQSIDEELKDPLVPQMSALEQCIAFIEACHHLGFHVILEYCPGKISIDHIYQKEHPEFFYWIKKEALSSYHAPISYGLPQNTLPFSYSLKDFYRSDDVKTHISQFVFADDACDKVIAPAFSDQINASLPIDSDATYFRFYTDFHLHVPSELQKTSAPFLTQDTIRCDLHPAKKPNSDLWNALNENISWYQSELDIDGIYLEKPYLLPEKLQKEMARNAKKQKKGFVMIAEDTVHENSELWKRKGFDAISGNSAYEETQIKDYKFHTFAYQLKGNACSMFAASEFYDSRRCSCLEDGKTLTNMLSIMNLFLPNGIPMYMNGIESYEVQPLQLSEYGDQSYLTSLPKEDRRYFRQPYVDRYYYNYTSSDLNVLPSLMEKANQIRKDYIDVMHKGQCCIPIWFDSPRDAGIGFTYMKEDKALMVICNTNVHESVHLHIHTENMWKELPFTYNSILQIYSTNDPYIHDVYLDQAQNIPLDFEPGEIKFIELKTESSS